MQDIEERFEFTCAEMRLELWLNFVWTCFFHKCIYWAVIRFT
jgi:hypothetical protein